MPCGEDERGVGGNPRKAGPGTEALARSNLLFGEERGTQTDDGDSRGKEGMSG